MATVSPIDHDLAYRAIASRDRRFDGRFFTGVATTGIYCRPSCPARTPARRHVRVFPSAAAARRAGYRACKRCRPDATPGAPEWNLRGDVAARALRLIEDGVVDREGVHGLARRLGYSTRQLQRHLVAELGAGPFELARARRVDTARLLLETTDVPISAVAFASGFGSIRQFNDAVHRAFALTPSALRRASGPRAATPGTAALSLRLPYRPPLALAPLLSYLGARAVPGVEHFDGKAYRRVLDLPGGPGQLRVDATQPDSGYLLVTLQLARWSDLTVAVARTRRLLDLDADPEAVAEALAGDDLLRPLLARRPGLRIPGSVDGGELAVRAVLGEQVRPAAARRLAGRLAADLGESADALQSVELSRTFPGPSALVTASRALLGLTPRRRAALERLCDALASGALDLEPGAERDRVEAELLTLEGIDARTASYVRLRALADPDALPLDDPALRLVFGGSPAATRLADRRIRTEGWRPWRGYALVQLWASLDLATVEAD